MTVVERPHAPLRALPSHAPDLDGEYYQQHSSLQHILADSLIDAIPSLSDKQRVFDIGCGDGSITQSLAVKMPHARVTGIDPSLSMISCANRMLSQVRLTNLDFQLQRAEDLSFRQRPDFITSFSAFHWVREPRITFTKLCKSLVHGGDLVLLTYVHSDYYQLLQDVLAEHYPQYQCLSAFHTMFSSDEYREVLQASGMKILEFKLEQLIAEHNDEDAMKDFIRGWLANFVPLPQEEHEDFLNLAVAQSRAYRLLPKDKIRLPYKKLTIRARKESKDNCCQLSCVIA
jgi:trans-aconitate 2-methyltransferase